jgi:hypothetical protein
MRASGNEPAKAPAYQLGGFLFGLSALLFFGGSVEHASTPVTFAT